MAFGFAGAQSTEIYRLQPEDVVRIQVFGIQEIASEAPVGKDGNISAPYIGIIKAGGLTTAELEKVLVREYIRQLKLRDPRLSVTIVRFRQMIASIGPAVNRPGQVNIRPGDTIMDLVNGGAGVLLEGRSDLRHVTFRKKGSNELIPIDLYAMMILGDLTQNYEVGDGDELNVPENKNNRVYVFGAVQQPGPRAYREGMTLSQALVESGGDIQYRTQLSKTKIQRPKPGVEGEYTFLQVDLTKFLAKNDATQNPVLQPGDIIFFADSKTPDASRIGTVSTAIANFFFILDRFGVNILGRGR